MSIANNKNVLITGGAGFIGVNFVHTFLDLGYKVTIIEKQVTNFWRLEKIKSKIKIYYPDLLKYDNIEKCIRQINPKIVLHFAAYGAYQSKQQNINTTIDTNLKGTINLINACYKVGVNPVRGQGASRKHQKKQTPLEAKPLTGQTSNGVKCFINTGTNSEYGIKNKPMKENDILEADNLYAITKSAATLYCQMMARKFNFPVVTIRPFAVYGYFEEKERLVPTIIKSCLKNNKLKLSSQKSVRYFIFIEDLIEAYVKIIKNAKKIKGQIFNVGTGKQYTISEVVTMAKKITGSAIKPVYGQVKKAQTEPTVWGARRVATLL